MVELGGRYSEVLLFNLYMLIGRLNSLPRLERSYSTTASREHLCVNLH